MSFINPQVTNETVIPTVETRIFDAHEDARFAMGVLAVADKPLDGLEKEYAGYYDLRRNVYVDQTGQLREEELHSDGTDRDADDMRSIAFGILENNGDSTARVVGSSRLIIKGFDGAKENAGALPVEEFFPEVFTDNPAPLNATEVSRMISRHEKATVQGALTLTMYSGLLATIKNLELSPTLAVVEPWYAGWFGVQGVPVKEIGKPRLVDHYLDENVPIRIDTDAYYQRVESQKPGAISQLQSLNGDMHYFGRVAKSSPVVGSVPVTAA